MPPFLRVQAVRKIVRGLFGRQAILLPRAGYAGLVKELESKPLRLAGWSVRLLLISGDRVVIGLERD